MGKSNREKLNSIFSFSEKSQKYNKIRMPLKISSISNGEIM